MIYATPSAVSKRSIPSCQEFYRVADGGEHVQESEKDMRPKPFVFVLMPFEESFDDTYKLAIKPACEEAGAYCERVDEQHVEGSIVDHIYKQIVTADLIVSDMTGRNANVFYETGYAHAIGKRVVLLTRNVKDIPFDLAQYQHIVYEGSLLQLKERLSARVRWMLENPSQVRDRSGEGLKVYLNGVELVEDAIVECVVDRTSTMPVLVLENPTDRVLDATELILCFVLPKELGAYAGTTGVKLPNGDLMVRLPEWGRFYPKDTFSLDLSLGFPERSANQGDHRVMLRRLTPYGARDLGLTLRLRQLSD
jgi:hypothetical protein